ncbi:hypothetical protein ACJX0J_042138, partial [Zea mays]
SVSASTCPVAATLGAAVFEEVLTLRSPVYFSRGAKAVIKYEPRAFAVSVAASTLDLGKHEVDLTRLLPLSFKDPEDDGDSGFGKWSTSFRLSSPARGAWLNVTFSCSLLAGGGTSKQHRGGEMAGLRRGSMVRPVSVQAPTPLPTQSRDVRVLHEVLPSLRSTRPVPSSIADGGPDARKEEVAAPDCTEEGSLEAKHRTSVEVKKGDSVRPDGDWARWSSMLLSMELRLLQMTRKGSNMWKPAMRLARRRIQGSKLTKRDRSSLCK